MGTGWRSAFGRCDTMPTCALCRLTVDQLKSSHIVPSWMYKRIRDHSGDTTRPEAVRVSANGEVTQKSWQLRDRLLCERCEHVFSERGEKYASAVSFQVDGSCPFHALVGHVPSDGEPSLVDASGVDVSKLAHFAVGVIWRAAVTAKDTSCHMPSRPRERLRRFLLGELEFPAEMVLYLFVLDQGPGVERRDDRTFVFPFSSPHGTFHAFGGAGLYFILKPYAVNEAEKPKSLVPSCKALVCPWSVHPLRPLVQNMVRNADPRRLHHVYAQIFGTPPPGAPSFRATPRDE